MREKIYQCFDDELLLKQSLERNDKNAAFPHEVITKFVNGENPIRVLRKYRHKTIAETAKAVIKI